MKHISIVSLIIFMIISGFKAGKSSNAPKQSMDAGVISDSLSLYHGENESNLSPGKLAGTQNPTEEKAGAITEKTPSKSNYFDWINSEWPGSHQDKVLANLDFFEWMNHTYGMQLDIYHMDAGNIDRSPNWIPEARTYEEALEMCYGHIDDPRFRKKFPDEFKTIVEKANGIGTRMGIWLGPDGYGNTPAQAQKRRSMLVHFCKDYDFGLFKFDHACTDLSKDHVDEFIKTMKACRTYTPDLIALNHRITLPDSAKEQMTTFLWEGKETYIDVHIWNETPAPHHRAGALSRGLPPGLSRLTEDHGVCISSCLDHWEDDLVLQAFNRNLILAPEIYGSPWLLRDDEFPTLARIYNLHRKYDDILVNGMVLPEKTYGKYAVSRGDENTRLITLRNLSWNKKHFKINLGKEIGLSGNNALLVKQFHPVEKVLGTFKPGESVDVMVEPFRSSLILITANVKDEFSIEGTGYRVIKNNGKSPVEIDLLAFPGETKSVSLDPGSYVFKKAEIDGTPAGKLLKGKKMKIRFEGRPLKEDYHRKLAVLKESDIPGDALSLYEATAFTADNNALEVRSLKRSGPSSVPQVEKARDMFFNDTTFWRKGIWDKYAFDNNPETFFKVRSYKLKNVEVKPGAFRFNLGEPVSLDKIVLKNVVDTFHIPTAEISADLINWDIVPVKREGKDIIIELSELSPVQFLEMKKTPVSINEIEVYADGTQLEPGKNWQLSNLFPAGEEKTVKHCWSGEFTLNEVAANSYLCVTVPGKYGNEGAWAALKIDGRYVGAPDRSPSFECNHWEHVVKNVDGNYTYYFPVDKSVTGKKIEAYVLGFSEKMDETIPEVWITAYPVPYVMKRLVLQK